MLPCVSLRGAARAAGAKKRRGWDGGGAGVGGMACCILRSACRTRSSYLAMCVCVCVVCVCVCVCRFLWLPHVALVLFRCMFRRLLVAEVSFFRMGLPLVSLWLGGGGSGRAGLSAPRLPPHHPALRPKRGFRKGSCQLPVGGRWPTPYSKIAMLDTEKARSACQVIPKVGVVTLCGCRKPGANLHQPGIEPGSHRWQRCILPLDH